MKRVFGAALCVACWLFALPLVSCSTCGNGLVEPGISLVERVSFSSTTPPPGWDFQGIVVDNACGFYSAPSAARTSGDLRRSIRRNISVPISMVGVSVLFPTLGTGSCENSDVGEKLSISYLLPGSTTLTSLAYIAIDGVYNVTASLPAGVELWIHQAYHSGQGFDAVVIDDIILYSKPEQCDDGNANSSDACVFCQHALCGDGKTRAGVEQCDEYEATPRCTRFCVRECGNGIVVAGEACDDGNTNNTDGCTNACTLPRCGDGIVTGTEQCDPPSVNCSLFCRNAGCGDGVLVAGEACDDGNTNRGDGCSPTCTSEFCGDGILTPGASANVTMIIADEVIMGMWAISGSLPVATSCGGRRALQFSGSFSRAAVRTQPFILQPSGLFVSYYAGDGSAACESPDFGEDVIVSLSTSLASPNWIVAGSLPGRIFLGTNWLTASIAAPASLINGAVYVKLEQVYFSGADFDNFAVEALVMTIPPVNEQCDDANNVTTDFCVNCRNATCGDGYVLAGVEQCDAGSGPFTLCNPTCALATCGDGFVNGVELCDDGNTASADDCSANCSAINVCGDMIVNINEACDHGFAGSPFCTTACTLSSCGDGLLNMLDGEACDDANTLDGDGCSALCQWELTGNLCGNGVVDSSAPGIRDRSGVRGFSLAFALAGLPAGVIVSNASIPYLAPGRATAVRLVAAGTCPGQTHQALALDAGAVLTTRPLTDLASVRLTLRAGLSSPSAPPQCTWPVPAPLYIGPTRDPNLVLVEYRNWSSSSLAANDGWRMLRAIAIPGALSVSTGRWENISLVLPPDAVRNQTVQLRVSRRAGAAGVVLLSELEAQVFVRELCDDGNSVATDACTNVCLPAACGDGIVWSGFEACDDGLPSELCNVNCQIGSVCGDGIVNYAVEMCDDGNGFNNDGCTNLCTLPTCGDGFVWQYYESCEPLISGPASCTSQCTWSTCGDAIVNAAAGEECDDALSYYCTSCNLPSCGDGLVQSQPYPFTAFISSAPTPGWWVRGVSSTASTRCIADHPVLSPSNRPLASMLLTGDMEADFGCSQRLILLEAPLEPLSKIDLSYRVYQPGPETMPAGCGSTVAVASTLWVQLRLASSGETPIYKQPVSVAFNVWTTVQLTIPVPLQNDRIFLVIAQEPSCCDCEPLLLSDIQVNGTREGESCDSYSYCGVLCDVQYCGNGVVDIGFGEICEPMLYGYDACSDCSELVRCGDGFVNSNLEQCDAGVPYNVSWCNQDCTFARCNDGKLNTNASETCEPAGVGACRFDCTLETGSASRSSSRSRTAAIVLGVVFGLLACCSCALLVFGLVRAASGQRERERRAREAAAGPVPEIVRAGSIRNPAQAMPPPPPQFEALPPPAFASRDQLPTFEEAIAMKDLGVADTPLPPSYSERQVWA